MRILTTITFILFSLVSYSQNFKTVINVETKQKETFTVFVSYNGFQLDSPYTVFERTGEWVITKEEEIQKAEATINGIKITASYKWDKINDKHTLILGKNIYQLFK